MLFSTAIPGLILKNEDETGCNQLEVIILQLKNKMGQKMPFLRVENRCKKWFYAGQTKLSVSWLWQTVF
jgi:hypothetical protein